MDLVTEQKLERRARILESARQLIAERGYTGLTMRDLAAHCRVSVPTLYNQFGGKDALLAAAVESHFSELLAGVPRDASTKGHERVLALVGRCADEMARLPRYHRALLRAFMGADETASLQLMLVGGLSGELERGLDEMSTQRQLAGWVATGVLARGITAATMGASAGWLTGELEDRQLRAAMVHAAATMVLGCARGAVRDVLEKIVRDAQSVLEGEDQAVATA